MVTNESGKQVHHRAGLWKQQNKSHKHGKHRSKGELDRESKGRSDLKTLTKKAKRELQRAEKRNRAQQLRKNKREEVMMTKRGLGGASSSPILSVIVTLHKDVNAHQLTKLLSECDDDATVTQSQCGGMHISIPRFRQRFSFLSPAPGNLYGILDAVKASDTTLFLLDSEEGLDEKGELILNAVTAHGLPTSVFVTIGNPDMHVKKKNESKKLLGKRIETYTTEEKLVWIEKAQDSFLLLRQIGSQKQRRVRYRETRPHLLAESYEFLPYPDQPETGRLLVRGYVRGVHPLSVYHLVHIPGVGDFQLSQIDKYPDPHPLVLKKGSESTRKDEEITMLMKANPNELESLQAENEIDPMEGEQTWPTEEELKEAEEDAKKRQIEKKKVPKGTSDYQAAWILNSDDEDADDDSDSDDDEDMDLEAESQEGSDEDEDEEEEEMSEVASVVTFATEDDRYDEKMDMSEEKESLRKIKEAREDEMFPDEMDTPMDQPARERFLKFRGLGSFRTSPWDPKENLPMDYQRIFTFQNFKGCRKQVMKENENRDGAMPGWFVQVHVNIENKDVLEKITPDAPLVLFAMLKHEQRMSVLNILLKRSSRGHLVPPSTVKNKDTLIFHVGFRRFAASAVFSQHTNGDKHKLERYFRPNSTAVASVFAPITFTPAPALAFKQRNDGSQELVGCGSLLSVDPYRIVLKRVVLSGYPMKIHKRSAVIRHMFFNREDITYFKPVELRTKCGRRGHILQPLGTHGHMKCSFDGQLASQDTVLLTLYKRIFPNWSYDPCVSIPEPLYDSQEQMAE